MTQPPEHNNSAQVEAAKRLGGLFGGNRKGPYSPVTKSLEQIGIELRILDVMCDGEQPEECIVIPVSELIFKEWRYMTGSKLEPQPQGEEPENAN